MNILALSGSFRTASLHDALVWAAHRHAPAGVNVARYDYRDVPLYNQDLPKPESVARLEAAILAADALLFAVPEYNHSVPGVLKNAIDWASRPAYQSVFRDKPSAVVSAAPSPVGGARGQQHMKVILMGMACPVYPSHEFLIGQAHEAFDDGQLVDAQAIHRLKRFMAGFVAWAERQGA